MKDKASTLEALKVSFYGSERPVEEEFPDAFECVSLGSLRNYYPNATVRELIALDSYPYVQLAAMVRDTGTSRPRRAIFELYPSYVALRDIKRGCPILPFAGARYQYDVTVFDFEKPLIPVAELLRRSVFGGSKPPLGGIIPGELTLKDDPICFNQTLDVINAKDILIYGSTVLTLQLKNERCFCKRYDLASLRILNLDAEAVIIPTEVAAKVIGVPEMSFRYDLDQCLRVTAMRVHNHVQRYRAYM